MSVNGRHLSGYEAKWRQLHGGPSDLNDGCVFDLSQNPEHCCLWTSRHGSLPTFRRNSKLWVPCLKRFLLPREAALLMGFSGPSLQHVHQSNVGNAMSLQTVGLMILAALLSAAPLPRAAPGPEVPGAAT